MDWFDAADSTVARFILQRGVALLFMVAFWNALHQFPALLGQRGLLPVTDLLSRRVSFWRRPTIFHWGYSDRLLRLVAWAGLVLAASVVLGLPQRGPVWVVLAVFGTIWWLYLSIVNVGQIFYGFGWESLLLEAGFLVAYLGSDRIAPPLPVLVLVLWLLFRVEFGAGLIKMRGDVCWRDLTCLDYHHQTQPMPGPWSWHFHHLPGRMHRVEVAANHVTQLVVPFALFLPHPIGTIAAGLVILTQGWLIVSGNFAWLNWVTLLLAFAAVPDVLFERVLPDGVLAVVPAPIEPAPMWFVVVVLAVLAGQVVLSYWPVRNLVGRRQRMNAAFNGWHLVGAYGAFGTVTRHRDEVIIEAAMSAEPGEEDWRAYEFRGKPGDVRRRPPQIAPYHLRLDWAMWFLALGSAAQLRWFGPFLDRLLAADPAVLELLGRDPFDGEHPAWVRARVFRYRYTTRAERACTGQWWHRELIGDLIEPRAADPTPPRT